MAEDLNGKEDIGRLSPELLEHTQGIKELVGGDEGERFANQGELRFELGRTLEELFQHVPESVNPAVRADPQQFVDTFLTAPEDSPMRQQLISQFADEPRAREFVSL